MTRTKRDRLTPYKENMKARTVTDADDLSAGFRDALKRADELIERRGGRRRVRELDDVTRAAALARLDALASGGERGAA